MAQAWDCVASAWTRPDARPRPWQEASAQLRDGARVAMADAKLESGILYVARSRNEQWLKLQPDGLAIPSFLVRTR